MLRASSSPLLRAASPAASILVSSRLELTVRFRGDHLLRPARLLMAELRRDGFAYTPGRRWAKGRRPNANVEQDAWGPEFTIPIDLHEARALFAGRADSPFGAYQRSALGYRTAHVRAWDARGIGFSILGGGYDGRRGGDYGASARQERHIIDDEDDMAEIAHAFALIERAKMRAV